MSQFDEKPYSDSHLDSPEYRKRLMRKLNTLIAVLEVACSKVRRSLAGPEPDVERLNRIHKNLKDTLQVCLRAKAALERCEKLPDDLPASLAEVTRPDNWTPAVGREGASVEMTSDAETRKFRDLGPIDSSEIRAVDLDALCRQLLG